MFKTLRGWWTAFAAALIKLTGPIPIVGMFKTLSGWWTPSGGALTKLTGLIPSVGMFKTLRGRGALLALLAAALLIVGMATS